MSSTSSTPLYKSRRLMSTLLLSKKEKARKRLRKFSTSIVCFGPIFNVFSEIVGEYGTRPLYKLLGYFSIVGLLRVHSLLGDFTLALKVMENVELNQKVSSASDSRLIRYTDIFQSPFTRVTACHVTTYYYVGFCYIMLRRYPDAVRTFVSILNFILRMRQYHTRSYQYDQVRGLTCNFIVPYSHTVYRSIRQPTACTLSSPSAMHFPPHESTTISRTLSRSVTVNSSLRCLAGQ